MREKKGTEKKQSKSKDKDTYMYTMNRYIQFERDFALFRTCVTLSKYK